MQEQRQNKEKSGHNPTSSRAPDLNSTFSRSRVDKKLAWKCADKSATDLPQQLAHAGLATPHGMVANKFAESLCNREFELQRYKQDNGATLRDQATKIAVLMNLMTERRGRYNEMHLKAGAAPTYAEVRGTRNCFGIPKSDSSTQQIQPNFEIMGAAGGSIKDASMRNMAGGAGFQPSTE